MASPGGRSDRGEAVMSEAQHLDELGGPMLLTALVYDVCGDDGQEEQREQHQLDDLPVAERMLHGVT